MGKKFLFVIITVVLVCSGYFFWSSNQPGTQVAATLPAGDQPEITATFPAPEKTLYRMSLYLDINTRTLYGTTVLTTSNTCGQVLSELWFTIYPDAFRNSTATPAPASAYYAGFEPAGIELQEIMVNFKPVDYIREGVSLQLIPAEDILPGQDITVEMKWKAQIPRVAYRYGYKEGVYMLGHFYPALNVYDDGVWRKSYDSAFGDPFCLNCADYLVRLNIPEAYSMVSTGSVVETIAEDNGRQFITVAAENVRDFAMVIAHQYQVLEEAGQGYTVFMHAPVQSDDNLDWMLQETIDILDFFSCTWGSYPYPEYKVVFVPMQGFDGMEYSGIVFLSDELLRPRADREHTRFLLAHETAHQWWYGLVGNDQVREPWLDEGLANWGAYKYLNQQGQATKGSGRTNLARELKDMHSRDDYYATAYTGGESFWWGLEQELGEEKVKQVLRSYLANYRFQVATTGDLLQIIQQEAQYDMQEYFNRWFN